MSNIPTHIKVFRRTGPSVYLDPDSIEDNWVMNMKARLRALATEKKSRDNKYQGNGSLAP